ncbi:MAG: nucleotidyl transferase AbiEii/AbiGii toxin family protein [Mariniphaga sp.]
MRLHENKILFRQAVQFTSDQMQILPIFIEKDYWVTYALHTIFTHAIGSDTVFKGGTALSKCYKMIDRFSEDIDLVVLRREGESDSQLKTKIRTISKVVDAVLPEINVEGLTHKMGMNRKTAHVYNKEFQGNYGQVRDVIVVEATWLGYYEPCTTKKLNSLVGEMMQNNGQDQIAMEYGLQPFDVRVLEPIRTLCEKIMSLVRFSYGENPVEDLKQKIRHTYDLHQLLQQPEFSDFFESPSFDEMLIKVANDDIASFRNNNQWLIHPPNEALIFRDLDQVWNDLRVAYNGDFKNLVYGVLPSDEAVLSTMKKIKARLTSINWTIKLEP